MIPATAGVRSWFHPYETQPPVPEQGSPQSTLVEVYGDESLRPRAQDVVGLATIASSDAATLRAEVQAIRDGHGWARRGEFAWTKASGKGPHPAYLELADLAVQYLQDGRLRFRCLAVPESLRRWISDDPACLVDQYRAWQTLLQGTLVPGYRFAVRLDARTDMRGGSLQTLRAELNRHAEAAGLGQDCVRSVEARDSRSDDLIQLVDVLVGAAGFHLARGHEVDGASAGKRLLIERLCRGLGLPDLCGTEAHPAWKVERWRET